VKTVLYRVGIAASHLRDRGGATGKPANQRAAAATLRAKNETREIRGWREEGRSRRWGIKMEDAECVCWIMMFYICKSNTVGLYENLGHQLANI